LWHPNVKGLLQEVQNKTPAPERLGRAFEVKNGSRVLAKSICNVVAAAATAWLNIRFAHVSMRRYINGKLNQTYQ
jgi:hypothetical protein